MGMGFHDPGILVNISCQTTIKVHFSSTIERKRASDEEEKRKYGRVSVCARRDDDETVVAQRARFRGIPVLMRSIGRGAFTEFVNRDLNAASNIRRCTVLKTRLEKLRRSDFVGQPLRLKTSEEI